MASLPSPKTATYGEWLRMPEVQDGASSAQVLREGVLKPKSFPSVQVPVAGIWPD